MTDRELLELAAKAAGVDVIEQRGGGLPWTIKRDGHSYPWDPLAADGDALRLAVKLGLCFGPNLDGDRAVVFGADGKTITEPFGDDRYAATRRAIVRAAASLAATKHTPPGTHGSAAAPEGAA